LSGRTTLHRPIQFLALVGEIEQAVQERLSSIGYVRACDLYYLIPGGIRGQMSKRNCNALGSSNCKTDNSCGKQVVTILAMSPV